MVAQCKQTKIRTKNAAEGKNVLNPNTNRVEKMLQDGNRGNWPQLDPPLPYDGWRTELKGGQKQKKETDHRQVCNYASLRRNCFLYKKNRPFYEKENRPDSLFELEEELVGCNFMQQTEKTRLVDFAWADSTQSKGTFETHVQSPDDLEPEIKTDTGLYSLFV